MAGHASTAAAAIAGWASGDVHHCRRQPTTDAPVQRGLLFTCMSPSPGHLQPL
eukprot:CAMPEP_0172832648 /NCGR_PEP_ID=MMETSP1075-20121228/23810_1 /TAXON_ID=2916 /ORGANISM="Ceratium fusus, Strain PA161109" /LENGTH=52 /DNA_ID=CAMNT_0013675287 /DNA_START=69 /DNA_END=227 /DNA_ORIENTATION=+